MMPLQSTRYLLQAIHWISRAIWWRQFDRKVTNQMTGWAKTDFRKWQLATFQA